jgi:hypothetical protein
LGYAPESASSSKVELGSPHASDPIQKPLLPWGSITMGPLVFMISKDTSSLAFWLFFWHLFV